MAVGAVIVTDLLAIAIAGYLTLGENAVAVAWLRWLYRWPLFIPFVVAGQMMRSFLAKNGLLNNAIVATGLVDRASTFGLLDWRGVIVTFVWKQLPFVALIVAGAMASLDRSMIESARNLGARRLRVLVEIVLPQVTGPLIVASVLTFVTLLSVLSVPMMINAGSPAMITVDMAYRITSLSDYGAANALGVISYLMTAAVAWLYLRQRPLAATEAVHEPARRLAVASGSASVSACSPSRYSGRSSISRCGRWRRDGSGPTRSRRNMASSSGGGCSRSGATHGKSLGTSVFIALLTVAASLLISVPAGYALARLSVPFRSLMMLAFLLPQAFPNLPVYINIARIFYWIGLNGTVLGVVLVHSLHGLVLSVWIAAAAFAAVDRSLEEAARNMGAGPLRMFLTVSCRWRLPGSWRRRSLSSSNSLDEFTGTYFVGVPDVITLPLLMFNASMGGNYQIAAITALILLIPSIGFMLVIERFLKADGPRR